MSLQKTVDTITPPTAQPASQSGLLYAVIILHLLEPTLSWQDLPAGQEVRLLRVVFRSIMDVAHETFSFNRVLLIIAHDRPSICATYPLSGCNFKMEDFLEIRVVITGVLQTCLPTATQNDSLCLLSQSHVSF